MTARRRIDLFYHGYEVKALDRPFGQGLSSLYLAARTGYRSLRRRQLYTGFYTAFCNLRSGLEALGMEVHVNDFAHARRHPDQVIGMAGFSDVYNRVQLPNPAVFGPGFVPYPEDLDRVTAGCNIRIFTQPSEWYCRIWRPKLGDRVQPMFVPIMLQDWPDLSAAPKTHDVVIYDKIRWHREERAPLVLERLQRHLAARGLSHVVLRYGAHRLAEFRAALSGGRAMVFLCEHETQGLAYQEALASGIPVLAWDEGELVDPQERRIAPPELKASTVPYFDGRCGETFTLAEMEQRFDGFWAGLSGYKPRDYVAEALSPERSARLYLDLLDRAAG
ncbi:hypothetical protein C5F48_01550 [Cereibacter changlensis JA139]|uniref:Glycosyltransferase n=2 Tax=Cereibacter changlensis TaxID=402884 RepID=A0A2T4K0L5_9RHOB|nr:glycosyltransferase [Cereibacter changlensis]PTE23553.1 hypothetical protein C5F48_01550 [Cereibacter changlensis JA139]PZX58529.1 hypothetical protein LX76_00029 [Cereibacter changlensis]